MARSSRTLALRSLLLLGLAAATLAASAQTATDACGYNAGNEYPVGTSCAYNDFDKPGSFTATYTASGCTGGSYDDAWGWFTAIYSTTNITYDPDDNHRAIVHVYTGTCTAGLTQVACLNSGGGGNNVNITGLTTTPGTTYMIRVQRHNDNSGMNGRICIWSPIPPANDEPCGATPLTVGQTCSLTATTTQNSTATAGIPAPGCANFTGNDVWYSFVAPANGIANIETTAGSLTDSGMALYSATACNGTFTLIECDANDGPGSMSEINRTGLTPNQTYYVRMWGEGSNTGTFNICIWSPPVNDDPCGAIALTLDATCSYTAYANTNASATAGIPVPGCGNGTYNDVWFTFTAPANGLVTLRTTTGSLGNPQFAVYAATSCSGPFTLVKCDNASGPGNAPFMTLTPLELVAGQTYYVRVWGSFGSRGSFNLCASTAPAAGDCIYVLRMWDSQGDGWGNSYVSVQVGAAPAVNYSIANGDEDVAYIPVATGQTVQLSYATGGSGNQGEIRYVLQLMYGAVYMDGPTPGTGLRYAGVADCQSAAPSNSDCYGRSAICGAQQISANPNNTGLTADLNVHSRGCLGSNERQGYWYQFTPSNGGTVGFTIAPDNPADDYDFAVWGPFGSASCPPTIAPVRCNYSGTTGNTGLSTLGTNPSEGGSGNKWSTLLPVNTGETYFLYISNYSQSGLAFNLSWQLTNGASLDCFLLPVELLGLNGYPVPQGIRLEWTTATEANSAFFAVERMDETGAFQQIGQVAAAGYSTSANDYAFLDPLPLPGFNYYRLKMVDADGSAALSDVVAVANRFGSVVSGLHPNPATDQVSVVIDAQADGEALVSVHDASGRLARQQRIALVEGQQRVSASVLGLEPGPYTLSLHLPGGQALHAGRFLVE
ncbi:MAG: hypothetical protein QY325_08140 [Flavobacteriales bacterium]|nr:MAG: hypothetical protein QY325_08140 [Flavobacteriales bacterium]